MRIRNFLNIALYAFLIIVPLVPVKIKVAFLPIAADTFFGGIVIILGLIYIGIASRRNKKFFNILKSKHMKLISIFILAFIILSLGSVIYAEDKVLAITEVIRFLEYTLIFYIVILSCDREFIKKGFILFYITMIISAIFGIIQFTFDLSPFFDDGATQPLGRGRVYSTFENPNYFAAAMNMVIFYPLICFIEKKGSRIVNFILFTLFFINLILTFTRGAWLGFGLGILIISVVKYRKMLLALPALLVYVIAFPSTRNRFLSILSSDETRIKIWKTGLKMFEENPILGVGNGNFIHRYDEYITKYEYLYAGRTLFTTHNSYLKMFAELGLIGGVLFLMIYSSLTYMTFKIYRFTKRYKKEALAFMGFFAAYLFQNFLNNLMFIPQLNVLVWIITAMLYKGYYVENMEG